MILLIGLNHTTAPVALREQIAMQDCTLRMALEDFRTDAPAAPREMVILSTCNRLEIYASVAAKSDEAAIVAGWHALAKWLANQHGLSVDLVHEHLYYKANEEAVTHLLRVAAGLDSLVLGEPQILGQVQRAYAQAHAAGATGPVLSHLFAQALHAGKRVRTETEISRHSTSISHAAVNLVRERVPDLATKNVLLVGAGEMAQLAAHALVMQDVRNVRIINRTFPTAQALAVEMGGEAIPWHELPAALTAADVVFTATGAPHPVVYVADVQPILATRHGRPLYFVDVAVPRDVDEGVAELTEVNVFDVDDLQAVVDGNLAQRQAEVPRAEAILEVERQAFAEWLHGRQVAPTIVDLRRKARAIADRELAQAKRRVSPEETQVLERLAHRLINKLLHEPTIRLKAHAAEGEGHDYAHMLRDLFALDDAPSSQKPAKPTAAEPTAANATPSGDKAAESQETEPRSSDLFALSEAVQREAVAGE